MSACSHHFLVLIGTTPEVLEQHVAECQVYILRYFCYSSPDEEESDPVNYTMDLKVLIY